MLSIDKVEMEKNKDMKIYYYLFLCLFCLSIVTNAKTKRENAYLVKYDYLINGKSLNEKGMLLKYFKNVAYLSESKDKIQEFIDYNNSQTVTVLNYNDILYKTSTPFDSLPQAKFEERKQKILGYDCKYAVFSFFSNTIEVWYTTQAPAKGGPYKNYIPEDDALVLKLTVNGMYEFEAKSITKVKLDEIPAFTADKATEVKAARLEELKIRSRYTSISVFKDEVVNFDPKTPVSQDKTLSLDSTYHFSNGSVILKRIKLPEIWKKGAYVYAKITQNSNGDAYDRVGSVFILPENGKDLSMLDAFQQGKDILPKYIDNEGQSYQGFMSTDSYDVPLEIMRFATSFGVKYFNTRRVINGYPWKENVTYKEEVTNLIPTDQDEITIGVFIGNYDKGGHQVSLDLDFYPADEDLQPSKKWLKPLFYTVNVMEMSGQNYGRLFNNDTLKVSFDIPENVDHLQLIYTTTGHGGWGGGDEYNQKLNQVIIDGHKEFSVMPWRTDCATYRLSNPASGNFGNGLTSSDGSRSNWCPGALTYPYVIDLENLKPGKHRVQIVIDQGSQEGTSFSHWCVSGVITGDKTNGK